jgi:hypothetical protein
VRDNILNQLHIVREITLHTANSLPEDQINLIPKGFNNSIIWNFGHILIVQEQLAVNFGKIKPQLPSVYLHYFGQHTDPSSWKDAPPRYSDILSFLKSQTKHIIESLGTRIDEKLTKPFNRNGLSMHTIGELLIYSVYHEGVHIGTVNSMVKVIQSNQISTPPGRG